MRTQFLACCALALCVVTAPALALNQAAPAQTTPAPAQTPAGGPATEGPRLIGRGTPLTRAEHAVYVVKTELCPQVLRVELVGGDLSDREIILIAVIVGLAVVVLVIAVA